MKFHHVFSKLEESLRN